jgi:type II secretion system protein D
MMRKSTNRVLAAAALLAAAGLARDVWGLVDRLSETIVAEVDRSSGAIVSRPSGAWESQPEVEAHASERRETITPEGRSTDIQLNFKDTPITQVIDFFSREAGLPVIFEAQAPEGALTFLSPQAYSFDDALTILNLNLSTRGVQLRKQDKFLYLSSLADSAKKPGMVVGELPEGARPEEILTLAIPLNHAVAATVVEQIKPLLGQFGVVLPVPQQNMVLVTDMAQQVTRIREIVRAIDQVKPADTQYKLFTLKHTQADAVFGTLKGLLATRTVQTFIAADGKRTTVQDDTLGALQMQPDPRTNAIVAVGAAAKIKIVEDMIALLDVPASADGNAGTQVVTISLAQAQAAEAAQRVKELFASQPEPKRPTVIALPQVNKITIVGPTDQIEKATTLLAALDPGVMSEGGVVRAETRAGIVRLKYGKADAVAQTVQRLLTPRQAVMVKSAPTPDGRGLIVHGPAEDVAVVERLVASLDVPANAERDVAIVKIVKGEVDAVVKQADGLYAQTGQHEAEPVSVNADAGSRSVLLVGSKAGLAAYTKMLETAQGNVRVERVGKMFDVTKATPSVLAERVAGFARILLRGDESQPFVEPVLEPADELRKLMVRAEASQMAVIEGLIARLDVQDAKGRDLRVFPVANAKAEEVAKRAAELYAQQTAGDPLASAVEIAAEEKSNTISLIADAAGMARVSKILDELAKQAGPAREVRMLELRLAKAEEVVAYLRDLVKGSETLNIKGASNPVFEPIATTNSVLVGATGAQLAIIEALVKNLDAGKQGERPPLRILKVTTSDAANLAQVLQASYGQRPAEERGKRPVDIQADAATNTLLVSAHPDVFSEIEKLVGTLNESQAADKTGREIRIFPLKVARAEELALTIDQMYPEPPIPRDPRTNLPRPDLKQPREVVVRADRATNALIVDAPSKRLSGFEEIVKRLDQAKVAGDAEVRTYRIARADLNALTTTLRGLVSANALPGAAATTPVTVSAEPMSRTIVVSAPKEAFATIEKVVKDADLEAVSAPGIVRMYALKNARVATLQPMVERLLMIRVAADAPKDATAADLTRMFAVAADPATNTVLISGAESVQKAAETLITQLDEAGAAGGQPEVGVFRLETGDAASVATSLGTALASGTLPGEPKPSVTAEPASNTVVITASRRQLDEAAKFVETMDKMAKPDMLSVRTINLRHARAETVRPVIEGVLTQESMLDMLPPAQRAQVISRGGLTLQPKVRVAAEARLNAIIVSGPKSLIDLAEAMVKDLDIDPAVKSPEGSARSIRVITLRNAEAADLAKSLEAVFREDTAGIPPTIQVDASSNALIVRADAKQLATIDEVVATIDAATLAANRQMKVISVDKSKADAEEIAETLRRMLKKQGGTKVEVISVEELMKRKGEEKEGKPGAMADERPNAEIAEGMEQRGEEDGMGEVAAAWRGGAEDLGSEISDFRGSASGLSPRSSAASAFKALLLASAFGVVEPEPKSEPNPEPKPEADPDVTIAVDPATNSVMIVGSPRTTEQLAKVAQQLQDQMPGDPATVRVVTLPAGVDQQALSQLVSQTVTQLGRRSATNTGGLSGPVSVLPDPTGNALIILANEADFGVVADLIVGVSQVSAASQLTIKVYPLSSVSAREAEDAIRDLMRPTPGGAQARRVRSAEVTVVGPDGKKTAAKLDPAMVRVAQGPSGASLIVSAPAEAVAILDTFIAILDQSPSEGRLAIRRYDLKNADANDLARTFQSLFDAQLQGPGSWEIPSARFIADERGNALLVTASTPQHDEVVRLLVTADAAMEDKALELAIIPLQTASPATVRRMVEEIVIGRDPAKKDKVRMSAEEGSSLFAVRASKEDLAEIRGLVERIDGSEVSGLPVRSIKLERADAELVARSITQFYQQRAQVSGKPGVRTANRVAIVGERRTGTLVVAASDEEFAQVEGLAKSFDAPALSADMVFKVIPLKHARISEIQNTVTNLIDEFKWTGNFTGQSRADSVFIQTNDRTNSIVVMGKEEMIATVERIVGQLDVPEESRTQLTIKAVGVAKADLRTVKSVVEQAMATPGWRSWRGADPEGVRVEIDQARRSLVLVGKAERVAQAAAYIEELEKASGRGDVGITSITLVNARADRAAGSLRQFFAERARAQGMNESPVSVMGSPDGNVLIVSADAADLATIKELVAQIDADILGKDRRTEIYVLQNTTAAEASNTLRAMFPRAGREEERVVITPQPTQNSVLVSAPIVQFDQIAALVRQLDAAPKPEQANIQTVTLTAARAQEVATALKQALPPNVKIGITAVPRSNSLMLTGSAESIRLAMDQIGKLDTEKPRALTVFRRFTLSHASSDDLSFTLRQMLSARPRGEGEPTASVDYDRPSNTLMVSASADAMPEVEKMIASLDVPPERPRKMDFIKLEYAKAEQTAKALENFYGRFAFDATPAARNVTIIPDPASNSLVISAEETQWEGIRGLLRKLDTKEYDTAQQSAVIALQHADAVSVARAINEGLRAPLQAEFERERIRAEREARGQRLRDRDEFAGPSVLIDAKDIPTVSAEAQTNSLVVFAGAKMLERIQALVKQLDVPALANINDIRVVPLKAGKPSVIAGQIRQLFLNDAGNERENRIRGVLIVGDDTAGALIVRAPEDKFAQIKALAEGLQTAVDAGRVLPHVFKLTNVPAARLAPTLQRTFTPIAQQMGESIGVEVDRGSNALVVACSDRLRVEVEKTIRELDVNAFGQTNVPGAARLGQSVLVVEVKNHAPSEMERMLTEMGLTRAQAADKPGVVSEPVTIVPMVTRSALAILAAPGDAPAVIELVKALDATPAEAGEVVQIVRLRKAGAAGVVKTLTEMLDQTKAANTNGPAGALAEQLRRFRLTRSALGQKDLEVDLSKPVRLIADAESNAVIVGSTAGNVESIAPVIEMLDSLPQGEAVVVRIFPLQNAQAARIKTVVDQLFQQGEQLSRLPGTQRRGEPVTATGQALIGDIAVALDERTNTIIVAGRQEAVALVEVLVKDLDSERMSNWIEPTIIAIKHGDAGAIADRLGEVLVRGLATTPEAAGLQKQYGRLRMTLSGKDATKPENQVQADLFAPLNGLVITSDPTLNAVIVVGSTGNVAVVRELIAQLDVEAASAGNTFRVFPLVNAAADRAVRVLQDLFSQREKVAALRPEDRLVVSTDARTNSLIVSSSARSLAVVETLLKTIDAKDASPSVSLHIVPVEGADVVQLAGKVQRLMRERIEAASRSGAGGVANPMDAFSVEAEPGSNVLIVAASDENFAVVKELIDALMKNGEALAAALETGLIQLKKLPVADAVTQIRDVYVKKEVERRGANAVSVTANERLNAVLVNGTAKDITEIRALVERLESTDVAIVRQLDRIELRSANALEVVNLLEGVLSGRGVGGQRIGARQATRVQYLRDQIVGQLGADGTPPTEAEIDGAVRDQVTLTPDLRTNAVLVTAPPQMLTLIREVIDDIDSNKADRQIEQFRLVNADATRMAEVLQRVFTLRQQGTSFVLAPPEETIGDDGQPGASGPSTVTAVPDERQALSIAVDARTNTLIVSGTAKYLDQVRELVVKLDGIEAVERLQTVYHLKNAKAKEMATTLQDIFRQESQLTRTSTSSAQASSLERQLEAEVTVVGDENSNKLLIATSPRYMDKVLKMVDELDKTPPQVTIQVLLAEVTIDADDRWGMDVRVGPFGGDVYNAQSLGGGPGGIANTLGGGNISVSSADFALLIRALEVQGKLQVLSRPGVTVNNNKTASINVGDNIAIATGTERTPQGSTRADVARQDVGITLDVTPRISNDGFVQMDIAPKISSVTSRTTQISEDFSAPIINQRTVKTVVNVKDGQSVVIGGLIQSSEEDRRSKVPILGDFPLIGSVFRTTQKTNVKTELLVILTPRVVPGSGPGMEERVRRINEQMLDSMSDPIELRRYLEQQDLRTKELESMGQPRPGDSGPVPESPTEPSTPAPAPAPVEGTPMTARRDRPDVVDLRYAPPPSQPARDESSPR